MQSFCNVDHYVEYVNKAKKKLSKVKVVPGWDAITAKIRALDGNRCRMCGTRSNLHCHHIVYRSEPGCVHDETNLITLCQEHHDLVHSNKGLYQSRCLGLVALRAKGDAFSRIKMGE